MIATRTLTLRTTSGNKQIPIRLFAPEQAADGHWLCRYEIDWPDGAHRHAAHGEDSAQALVIALQMIGSVIYASDYHKSGQLMLDEPGRGYGFPVTNNLRDLLIGDDRTSF